MRMMNIFIKKVQIKLPQMLFAIKMCALVNSSIIIFGACFLKEGPYMPKWLVTL